MKKLWLCLSLLAALSAAPTLADSVSCDYSVDCKPCAYAANVTYTDSNGNTHTYPNGCCQCT
jgi:hypothetical protein